MRDARDFNPYIIHMNVGQLQPGQIVSERMCMWYEIELITHSDGGGVLTLDQLLPARKGTIYVRKPGMIVKGIPPYGFNGVIFDVVYDLALEPYYEQKEKCMNAQFDATLLSHIYARDFFFEFLECLPPRLEVRNYDLFFRLMDASFHLFLDRPQDYQFHAKSLLMQIIEAILEENSVRHQGDANIVRAILDVQRFIDTHYTEPLTLAMLAKKSSMSREYLCRLFRRIVGRAPIEYLLSVRLFHAKQLLIITSDPIERVVAQSGFSSQQHFHEVFKRSMNMTPGRYRAEKQGRG